MPYGQYNINPYAPRPTVDFLAPVEQPVQQNLPLPQVNQFTPQIGSIAGVNAPSPIQNIAAQIQQNPTLAPAAQKAFAPQPLQQQQQQQPQQPQIQQAPQQPQPQPQQDGKLSIDDFAQSIKNKYPEYANIDNNELAQKMIAKYPEYTDKVNMEQGQDGLQTPMQGGFKGGAAREGSSGGAIEWINPLGKTTEELDDLIQKIGVVDFTKGREVGLEQRISNLSQTDIENYRQQWEKLKTENPKLSNLYGNTVEGKTLVGKMWNIVKGNTQKMPDEQAFRSFIFEKEKNFVDQMAAVGTKGPKYMNMMGNIPGSTLKTMTATLRAMTNPYDTMKGLYTLIATPEGRQALSDRYGSWDNLARTMEEDPVGLASDFLALVEGGAKLGSMGAKLAGASETAAKLSDISRTAGVASNIGTDFVVPGIANLGAKGGKVGSAVATALIAPTQPLKTAIDAGKYAGEKLNINTNKIAEKVQSSANNLNPQEVQKYKSKVGQSIETTMLENDMVGSHQELFDQSINKSSTAQTELRTAIKSIKDPVQSTLAADSVDHIISQYDTKIPGMDKIIKPFQEMSKRLRDGTASLEDLQKAKTMQAEFQNIFDQYGHVPKGEAEKKLLADNYMEMKNQIEDIASKYGIDIQKINHDIMKFEGMRRPLGNRLAKDANMNIFSLTDSIITAGSFSNPAGFAVLAGKKILGSPTVKSKIAQALYKKTGETGMKKRIIAPEKPRLALPAPKATEITKEGVIKQKGIISPVKRAEPKRIIRETGQGNVKQPIGRTTSEAIDLQKQTQNLKKEADIVAKKQAISDLYDTAEKNGVKVSGSDVFNGIKKGDITSKGIVEDTYISGVRYMAKVDGQAYHIGDLGPAYRLEDKGLSSFLDDMSATEVKYDTAIKIPGIDNYQTKSFSNAMMIFEDLGIETAGKKPSQILNSLDKDLAQEIATKIRQSSDKVMDSLEKKPLISPKKPKTSPEKLTFKQEITKTPVEKIPTANKAKPESNKKVQDLANNYSKKKFGKTISEGYYMKVDEDMGKTIAAEYDKLPVNDLNNPKVKKAYGALEKEINEQWDYATKEMGVKFIPREGKGQPYANSTEMARDISKNNRLFFFTGGDPHPLLGKIDPKTGLSANDKFRAIHDLFGHSAEGFGFAAKGEENARLKHAQMFSDDARKAMTSETRGQNSWVNYGKQNYNADGSYKNIPPSQRPYAEQKVALLPDKYSDIGNVVSSKTDIRNIIETTKKEGGITYDLLKQSSMTNSPNISISPYAGRTKIVDLSKLNNDIVIDYIVDNADILMRKDHKLGLWIDGKDLYIDVSITIPKSKIKEAKILGEKLNQKAIYDLDSKVEINTMGDGKSTKIPESDIDLLVQNILSSK